MYPNLHLCSWPQSMVHIAIQSTDCSEPMRVKMNYIKAHRPSTVGVVVNPVCRTSWYIFDIFNGTVTLPSNRIKQMKRFINLFLGWNALWQCSRSRSLLPGIWTPHSKMETHLNVDLNQHETMENRKNNNEIVVGPGQPCALRSNAQRLSDIYVIETVVHVMGLSTNIPLRNDRIRMAGDHVRAVFTLSGRSDISMDYCRLIYMPSVVGDDNFYCLPCTALECPDGCHVIRSLQIQILIYKRIRMRIEGPNEMSILPLYPFGFGWVTNIVFHSCASIHGIGWDRVCCVLCIVQYSRIMVGCFGSLDFLVSVFYSSRC